MSAVILGHADEQQDGWVNAKCPYCDVTVTYDEPHKNLVSKCRHLVGRTADRLFLFKPEAW